ncbi:alkylation response protein AidB-like acyl-CoA dehydrogenase [Novosphingobium hassiacum]|uniref:Alkylation response protein AidB-like acyl-CoA dehydrogenase n=1 Tax=Novosphingobium hassiacum TaxID=173676 RepID=A0A7W6EWL5_9SPHN|nr:acyl-CoA dehydrogenase family protein [Novosphingobium hassiacum]MBB3860974.1 alkylation response protein AidB-like acyl-CoA dehydrogenase [Novosphingobium hassiacum]
MSLIDPEARQAMRESFARLLADRCTEADVRRIMAADTAHDPDLWRAMADLGVLATLIPETFGGLGGGALEAETLMEEAGAALLPGPFFSSAVLATAMLVGSQDDDAKQRLLPALASGEIIGTVALAGPAGLWDATDGEIVVTDGCLLSGSAHYVSDGALADLLLVVTGTGTSRQLYEVTDRTGVALTPLKTFDMTQPLAKLVLDKAEARAIVGADATAIDHALDIARVALAGRQAGAAQRNFDFTVEYLRNRVQFGRPVGGFQAIKHMAADLLIERESALTGARIAAERLAAGADDSAELVAMASFAVSEAQLKIASDSIQLHGGIGFTWDYPAHLYLRRARHDQMFLGSNAHARERFVSILEKTA